MKAVEIFYSDELKSMLDAYHIDDLQKMYQADAFDDETKLKLRPYLKLRFTLYLTNDHQRTGIHNPC